MTELQKRLLGILADGELHYTAELATALAAEAADVIVACDELYRRGVVMAKPVQGSTRARMSYRLMRKNESRSDHPLADR